MGLGQMAHRLMVLGHIALGQIVIGLNFGKSLSSMHTF